MTATWYGFFMFRGQDICYSTEMTDRQFVVPAAPGEAGKIYSTEYRMHHGIGYIRELRPCPENNIGMIPIIVVFSKSRSSYR